MYSFSPKDSDAFGTLEKIATIVMEGRHLIIGDPTYGIDNSRIKEFSADSLLQEAEPQATITKYRVLKESGSFYEVDTLEDAQAVAKRERTADGDLNITKIEHQEVPELFQYTYIRVALSDTTKSIDVFEVHSVAASYGHFGYYLQFSEPDPDGEGYAVEAIETLPVDGASIMFCDETTAGSVIWEGDSYQFQGQPMDNIIGHFPSATILDHKGVGGAVIDTSADGAYEIEAVYEINNGVTTLLGVFLQVLVAGPHELDEDDFDDESDGTDEVLLGMEYQLQGNDEKAIYWLRKSAELGDSLGQSILGRTYLLGDGVDQDFDEAVKWFRASAEQDDQDGQFWLGSCYLYGDFGLPLDEGEAVKWFQLSAEQGHDQGQFELGRCYNDGMGIEEDNEEAVKWFKASAEQDNSDALDMLGNAYLDGIGVELDEVKAFECFKKSYDIDDNADAQVHLGMCYGSGMGVEEDLEESIILYKLSAERGHELGQFFLGFAYLEGDGVEQDGERAMKWFHAAAEQGNTSAMSELARCYEITNDAEEAKKWRAKLGAAESHED